MTDTLTKLRLDVDHNMFSSSLKVKQDITDLFTQPIDHAYLVSAVVLRPRGLGGGNPYVEFAFNDVNDAWTWFSVQYGPDQREEFELGLVS